MKVPSRRLAWSPPALVLALAAALAGPSGGCAAMGVKPPPEGRLLVDPQECTRSNGRPIMDIVGAGLSGGTAAIAFLVAVSEESSRDREAAPSWDPHFTSNPTPGLIVGTAALAVAAGFVASSHYGFSNTSACRRLYRETYEGPRYAPGAYPPWAPQSPVPAPQ